MLFYTFSPSCPYFLNVSITAHSLKSHYIQEGNETGFELRHAMKLDRENKIETNLSSTWLSEAVLNIELISSIRPGVLKSVLGKK